MKKDEMISLKISHELLQRIIETAKKDKRGSRSEQVRVLVEEALEARSFKEEKR